MNDGGPAFPRAAFSTPDSYATCSQQEGMTLRDYFAGQALMGMLADYETSGSGAEFADRAYDFADAMLAEREKRREGA